MNIIKSYRSPWVDHRQVYFAIVHTPRSGSNYLAELLDSADDVTCHTEIFSPKSTYLSRQDDVPYIDKETRNRDFRGFLRCLIAHASGSKAFGFKVGMYDLRSMLLYVLFSRRVKKLVIERRNLLAAFLSLKDAKRSGAWIQWAGGPGADGRTAKHRLSLGEFYIYAAKIKAFYLVVKIIELITMQKFKWIAYEGMMTASVKADIGDFLDIDFDERLSARTQKQNQRPIRDRIDNIEQVERSMKFINAKWMLNENA